jgi:hypothetical protein
MKNFLFALALAVAAFVFLYGASVQELRNGPYGVELGNASFGLAGIFIFTLAVGIRLAVELAPAFLTWLENLTALRHPNRRRVLSLLLDRVRGQVSENVFQGRFKDRDLRIEVFQPSFGQAQYLIELESPLGLLPVTSAPIDGVDAVEQLAREALERANEDPKLAKLADSLLSGENDWRALFVIFGVEEVSFANGRVQVRASFGEGFAAPDEAVRLERMLDRLASVSAILGSILAITKRDTKGRCPYCHDELTEAAMTWDCPKCGSRHHQDCRDEHGRCAVFGCSEAEKVSERVG